MGAQRYQLVCIIRVQLVVPCILKLLCIASIPGRMHTKYQYQLLVWHSTQLSDMSHNDSDMHYIMHPCILYQSYYACYEYYSYSIGNNANCDKFQELNCKCGNAKMDQMPPTKKPIVTSNIDLTPHNSYDQPIQICQIIITTLDFLY